MRAGRDVVLVYHGIGSVARGAPLWNGFVRPERFAAQMARLARERRVVGLDAIAEGAAGRGRVAITFDDAYRTALVHAVPVLRELGLPATFFVPTRWIGERNTWDRSDGLPVDIMDSAELGALAEQGFAIESHGHAHIDYARAAPGAVEEDLARVGRAPHRAARPRPALPGVPVRARHARRRRRGEAARAARRVHPRRAAGRRAALRHDADLDRPRRSRAAVRAQAQRALRRPAPQRARPRPLRHGPAGRASPLALALGA